MRALTARVRASNRSFRAAFSASRRRSSITGARRSRATLRAAAGAVSGRPALKGGAGAYSRLSSIASATSLPASSAITVRAKSMPAVTPPPVTRLPSRTTRA